MFDSREWNEFVIKNGGFFRQSWEWGEFQKALGHEVVRLQSDNGVFVAQLIKQPLPLGRHYWYCPRGPAGEIRNPRLHQDYGGQAKSPPSLKLRRAGKIQNIFNEIIHVGKESGGVFVRVEPGWERSKEMVTMFEKVGFQEVRKGVQPQETLVLDLIKKEEALLATMHEKTRYNIRLAERRGVAVAQKDLSALAKLWPLFQATAKRDRFSFHSLRYYQKMLEVLHPQESSGKHGHVRLWVAEREGKTLAAAIVSYFGDTATYLHGAMDYEMRQHMGPQLLHWRIMVDAKLRGFSQYDFGGISEQKWPGVTRFKLSFGGKCVQFAGVFDFPVSYFNYRAYRVLHALLK